LWHPDHQEMEVPGVPRIVGAQEYRSLMEGLCPGRRIAELFIPARPARTEVLPRHGERYSYLGGRYSRLPAGAFGPGCQ
jgi:hypothetical protein